MLSGHFSSFAHPLAYANAILQKIMEDVASVWVALDAETKEIKSLALLTLGAGTGQLPTLYLLYLVSPAGVNSLVVYKEFVKALSAHYKPLGVVALETQVDSPEKKALAAGCGASFYEAAVWEL
jgi:hypothetical protein